MARDYKQLVSNVRTMLAKGAPDEDIRSYLSYEGFTVPQFEELLKGPTLFGQAKEALKGIPSGAINVLESAGVGLSSILPDEYETGARRTIQEIGAAARSPFEAKAGYEETIGRKGGEALGSTVPFFAMGPLGTAGRVGAAALGTGAGAGEARLRAEQEGATPEQRRLATGLGAGIGVTEVLPVFAFLDNLSAPLKQGIINRVQRALVTGGAEAAQEAAAAAAQNLIAQKIYKPDQSIIEGVGEEAAYGGAVGALIQGITDMALGRKSARTITGAKQGQPGQPSPTEEAAIPVTDVAAQETATKLFTSYEEATLEIERLKQETQTDEIKARIKELQELKQGLVVDSVNRLRANPAEDLAKMREEGVNLAPAAALKAEQLSEKGTQGEFRETLGLPVDFSIEEKAERDAKAYTVQGLQERLDSINATKKLLEQDQTIEKSVRETLLKQAADAERSVKRELKKESAGFTPEVEPEVKFETVLDGDLLKNVGLKPQSGFYKELVGLDMAKPEDAAKIADVLRRVRANSALSDSTKQGIEGVAMQAFNALSTQQEFDFGKKRKAKPEGEVITPVQEEMQLEPEVAQDVEQPAEDVAGTIEPSVPVSGEAVADTGGVEGPEGRGVVTPVSAFEQPTRREAGIDPALVLEQKAKEELAKRQAPTVSIPTEPTKPLNARQDKEFRDAASRYIGKTESPQQALDYLAGDLYAKENLKFANRFLRGLDKEQRDYVEAKMQELKDLQRKGTIALKRKDARLKIERARQAENPELVAKLEKELEQFNNKYKNAKLEREDLLGGVTPKLVSAVRAGNTRGA